MAIFSSVGQIRSTAGPRVDGSSQASASSIRPACSSGFVRASSSEQGRRLRDEHARVPEVVAALEVPLRRLEVGLLHEVGHRLDALGARSTSSGAAALDVAEAHGRLGGRDADRGDVPGARGRDRVGHGGAEQRVARDHVVGGERADHDAGLAALEDRGGEADGGRRVARLALEHDVLVGERRQLRLDGRAVGAAGHDHDALLARERGEPVPRVLQQRLAGAREVVQELGGVGA